MCIPISLWPDPKKHAAVDSDSFAVAFARIECHYFVNGGFLDTDDQIIRDLHKIKNIPCVLIQGRYDMCTPARTAWIFTRPGPRPTSGWSAMPATRAANRASYTN